MLHEADITLPPPSIAMAGAGSAQNESRVAQIPAVWRYFGSDGAAVAVAMAFVMQCSDRAPAPRSPEGPFLSPT